MLRAVFLFVLICFSFSPAWGMGEQSAISTRDPLIGRSAPDMNLPKSDGSSGSLMAAREGSKAILIFWATWCPHCREEVERVRQLLPELVNNGIKVILVNEGESREEVNAYFNNRQIGLVSFLDEENALQGPYQIQGVPTVIFVNADGTVLKSTYGGDDLIF